AGPRFAAEDSWKNPRSQTPPNRQNPEDPVVVRLPQERPPVETDRWGPPGQFRGAPLRGGPPRRGPLQGGPPRGGAPRWGAPRGGPPGGPPFLFSKPLRSGKTRDSRRQPLYP
ncbi:hypothetical protein ETH_00035655, partial [Eimeria tenella]